MVLANTDVWVEVMAEVVMVVAKVIVCVLGVVTMLPLEVLAVVVAGVV